MEIKCEVCQKMVEPAKSETVDPEDKEYVCGYCWIEIQLSSDDTDLVVNIIRNRD